MRIAGIVFAALLAILGLVAIGVNIWSLSTTGELDVFLVILGLVVLPLSIWTMLLLKKPLRPAHPKSPE